MIRGDQASIASEHTKHGEHTAWRAQQGHVRAKGKYTIVTGR